LLKKNSNILWKILTCVLGALDNKFKIEIIVLKLCFIYGKLLILGSLTCAFRVRYQDHILFKSGYSIF